MQVSVPDCSPDLARREQIGSLRVRLERIPYREEPRRILLAPHPRPEREHPLLYVDVPVKIRVPVADFRNTIEVRFTTCARTHIYPYTYQAVC
jgi:hypothetical protein